MKKIQPSDDLLIRWLKLFDNRENAEWILHREVKLQGYQVNEERLLELAYPRELTS